jgi:competence protein ComEA
MENIDKRYLLCLAVILIAVFAAGVKYSDFKKSREADEILSLTTKEEAMENRSETDSTQKNQDISIKVYICGEIQNPGVYELQEGSRVYEVIEMAGGALETSELRCLDMARILRDQETILVPVKGENAIESVPLTFSNSSVFSQPGKVNINTASADEMAQELTGIGPVLAQRIIDYRETNGAFKQIEDLKNVSGIGDKRFEDIKDSICVR